VVTMPVPGLTMYLAPQAVSESLEGLLDHSNTLSIGARFGSRVKIDFILNTLSLEDALTVRNVLDIPRFIRAGTEVSLQPYLKRIRVNGNQVQGTGEASSKNLDAFWEALVNQRLGTETIQ
jgi:O-methyltransferase involved in polyketide biosynthesis